MVKEARPGRVKTRLGREIGMTAAAWWFRHQSASALRRLRDPRWNLSIAVTPDREGMASRVWPAELPRIPQGRGDLGDRMARLLRTHPIVLVVGADIPGLRRHHIARALRRLRESDAVLGPATDGGFWAIGWRGAAGPPATLFRGVRWSTSHALADTLASIPRARVALADTLSDVDTAADLAACRF